MPKIQKLEIRGEIDTQTKLMYYTCYKTMEKSLILNVRFVSQNRLVGAAAVS